MDELGHDQIHVQVVSDYQVSPTYPELTFEALVIPCMVICYILTKLFELNWLNRDAIQHQHNSEFLELHKEVECLLYIANGVRC